MLRSLVGSEMCIRDRLYPVADVLYFCFSCFFICCTKHWCTGSCGDSIALQTCCSTTVPSAASCTSPVMPVHSVPVPTAATSCADSAQAVLSTKRKRKFPGPAAALPKLVRTDIINISHKKLITGAVRDGIRPLRRIWSGSGVRIWIKDSGARL